MIFEFRCDKISVLRDSKFMRTESSENRQKIPRTTECNKRVKILLAFYWLIVGILVLHLIKLQIFDPYNYREKGRIQRANHDFAVRGDIYDRHGNFSVTTVQRLIMPFKKKNLYMKPQ